MGSPQLYHRTDSAPIYRIDSDAMAAEALFTARRLAKPASEKWIAGRISTMMVQYFAAALPPDVQAIIASDWIAELRGKELPGWAIQKAVRWWMGAENTKRHQKPMPGDISAIALSEIQFIRNMEAGVQLYHKRKASGPVPWDYQSREPAKITEESKARVDALVKSMFRAPVSEDE